MPLPLGSWKANVNGHDVELVLPSPPDAIGMVRGQLSGEPLRGFWNEAAQEITFDVLLAVEEQVQVFATFTGVLFRSQNAEPGRDVTATITGHLRTHSDRLATVVFGQTDGTQAALWLVRSVHRN